jgi:hypothetical protein
LTESSPLITEENRQKLVGEWAPYWDWSRRFLLEKSPPNLVRTRFLEAMFPNSSFIVLMRHPLAVSYATRAWYRHYRINWRPLARILEHWLVCHEIFLQDQKHLKSPTMIVRYEDFVAEPQHWVARIQDMLGIEHHPTQQKILSGVNQKYFARWSRERQGMFSGPGCRAIMDRFEDRCRKFGYSLAEPERIAEPVSI